MSCNIGALDNGFAQNLANKLNVEVYAPTNYLWSTPNVNFVIVKQMLEKREACILKAKAPKIKPVITKLQKLGIDFNVNPSFDY